MLSPGAIIGNYRVLQKIGTGGMGAVYLAEHPLIGKKVALKVIHKELASNREVVQRFFQEARAVNQIGNEHIVEIHDFGVSPEGDHFYIMEFLEGQTLASVLTHSAVLDMMRALHIGAQIANALGAAHVASIIHRDLKPDNIMLMNRMGDRDFVKVLDFGLAKMFQGGGANAVQTAAGVLLGTPQYMSPEACESKRDLIDHRTDIYALGVLLFQMMTGVLPFTGDSMGEVLVKQVTALPPAPRGLNANIPPSVEQIVLRCLAKQRDARFPTMKALRDALLDPEAYLRASPPMAAARSVAPGEGVSAAQVIAAAEQRTRMLEQSKQTGYAATAAFSPGGAPPPPQYGQQQHYPPPGYPNHHQQQRTMIDGSHGAPPPAMQNYNAAATMVAGVQHQLPPGVPLAQAPRTMIAPPGLQQPVAPKMNTMRIATPLGHISRPPRRVWPIVLVIGLVLGIGGGGLAVYLSRGAESGSDEPAGSGSAVATGSAPGSAKPATPIDAAGATVTPIEDAPTVAATVDAAAPTVAVDAAVATVPVDAAAVVAQVDAAVVTSGKLVKLTLDSQPAGASVFGPDGAELGKTPLKMEWPSSSTAVKFTFKLKGWKDKVKELAITANTMTRVDLDRAASAVRPPAGSGSGSGKTVRDNGVGNGLERPD